MSFSKKPIIKHNGLVITESIVILFSLAQFTPSISRAATCSCAGVPLVSSAQLLTKKPGEIQIAATYSYHDLSELVAGSESVIDETGRNRETQSMIFRIAYGLTENWSIGGLISYIDHTRSISISNQSEQRSNGMGDSLLSVNYSPQKIGLFNRNEFVFGVGLRIPTGVDDNGLPVYIEDLQPSQGAWGTAAWVYWAHSYNQQASWKSFTSLSVAHNDENDREYSFEDEYNAAVGIIYTTNIKLAYSAALGWRKADPHTRFGGEIPNTGGRWINFTPSIQYTLGEKTAVKFSTTIPVDRELNGTLQFTSKISYSFEVAHSF